MAYNYGLLSMNYGVLWGIVAYYIGLLGFSGIGREAPTATVTTQVLRRKASTKALTNRTARGFRHVGLGHGSEPRVL